MATRLSYMLLLLAVLARDGCLVHGVRVLDSRHLRATTSQGSAITRDRELSDETITANKETTMTRSDDPLDKQAPSPLAKVDFSSTLLNPLLNLTKLNLTDVDLSKLHLADIDLSKLNLTDIMSKLNLTDIDLSKLNLTDINLSKLNLADILSKLNLTDIDLAKLNLTDFHVTAPHHGDEPITAPLRCHPPEAHPPSYGDHLGVPAPCYGDSSSGAPVAPTCMRPSGGCFFVNATSGGALDAYHLVAPDWVTRLARFQGLLYEFGVSTSAGASIRQAFSPVPEATIVGLPAGNATTLYVCVSAADSHGAPAGPKACETLTVNVSGQVTAQQVADQLSAIDTFAKKQNNDKTPAATAAAALDMAHRLAAVAAAVPKNSSDGASVKSLASGLLNQLLSSATAASNDSSASSVLAAFDGASTLWSMAGASGRAAAVSTVGEMAKKLAIQSLAAADAQPVMSLVTQMLDSASDIVLASVNNSTANGTAVAAAARSLLASVTQAAAALTQGLLNGAPANGTTVYVSTARLAAAVQRATAALAAAGVTVSLAAPSAAATAANHRRNLLSAPAVSVSLSPSVGSLCAADTVCSSAGLGLAVTVTTDTSLLSTALGGSFTPLVAGRSDYRAGGAVQVISPIVRVASSGLPAAALGLSSLVLLDLPVNTSALDTSAKRVLVRLQDFGAASVDATSGIPANSSVTVTQNSVASSSADLVSGYSNELGDFAVVQYATTAVPTSGTTGTATTGAAGPARLPSSVLMGALVGAATLAMAMLA